MLRHDRSTGRRGRRGAAFMLCVCLSCGSLGGASWANAAVPRPLFEASSLPPDTEATVRRALSTSSPQAEPLTHARIVYDTLREQGWLWARVRPSAGADTLYIRPGPRAKLAPVSIEGADSALAVTFTRGAGWNPGAVYLPGEWEAQALRGLRALGELGYPFASLSMRSIAAVESTATVHPSVWLAPGQQAVVASVTVVGATHTRAQVLQRLSGLRAGTPYRESMLREAEQRLLAREVVARVHEIAPRPSDGLGAEVDLRVALEQAPSTGRVAAALGLVRDAKDDRTRLSGSVDLALLDLFGTARQLRATWLDDGATRSKLDIGWLEPLLLGTPLDLRLGLGQRHQDELFDTVLADLALRLPWTGGFDLEVGAGVDRTTFVESQGRTRSRQRLSVAAGVARDRSADAGAYGTLRTRFEVAKARESFTLADTTAAAPAGASTEQQTIVDAHGRAGWAFSRAWAAEGRAAWQSVDGERLPVPDSELWYVGGATSVRGYREEQFRGETAAFGGGDLVLGPHRGGQVYAFYDVGWVRRTAPAPGQAALQRVETWLHGFGLGLRTPSAAGWVDLSIGFADRLSFDAGKIHLALVQGF